MKVSKIFLTLSALGVVAAVYHAWSEKAFSTNLFDVHYSSFASFFGVPYYLFGLIWFPLILAVGLWSTRLGNFPLSKGLLALLTIGNIFTVYLWYLDIMIVRAYAFEYIILYVANYALTGLVVFQNWSNDIIHGFAYGTIIGAVIGVLFGPFGIVACAVTGGIFGMARNYSLPIEQQPPLLKH